jgi:hypothetical protein
MSNPHNKPGRPLGLSVAIFTVWVIFSLMPLILVFMYVRAQSRFNEMDWTVEYQGQDIVPYFSGSNLGEFDNSGLITLGLIGVVFFVICILAWVGRPRWIRHVLLFSVLSLDVFFGVMILSAVLGRSDAADGVSSADGLIRSGQIGYVLLAMLATLYLVWYSNRAPARAFYRGYYLPDPQQTERKGAEFPAP